MFPAVYCVSAALAERAVLCAAICDRLEARLAAAKAAIEETNRERKLAQTQGGRELAGYVTNADKSDKSDEYLHGSNQTGQWGRGHYLLPKAMTLGGRA